MDKRRTDLAMESMAAPSTPAEGLQVDTQHRLGAEITWVRIYSAAAAQRIGKPEGCYWTLTHPRLPEMLPEDRLCIAREAAQVMRILLPPKGDVLVLGLGNRRMTADALGDRVVSGMLVTRHMQRGESLRSVCAVSPGVLGVTGMETAEVALGLTRQLKPGAVIVIDALAAMETSRICTTIQITNTGIHPGSGVGNHRKAITEETLGVPVIAVGIPMVVYASTIVRDALEKILAEEAGENAHQLAAHLTAQVQDDLVVTPRGIDELVQGLSDMLALAINSALQPEIAIEELSMYLH